MSAAALKAGGVREAPAPSERNGRLLGVKLRGAGPAAGSRLGVLSIVSGSILRWQPIMEAADTAGICAAAVDLCLLTDIAECKQSKRKGGAATGKALLKLVLRDGRSLVATFCRVGSTTTDVDDALWTARDALIEALRTTRSASPAVLMAPPQAPLRAPMAAAATKEGGDAVKFDRVVSKKRAPASQCPEWAGGALAKKRLRGAAGVHQKERQVEKVAAAAEARSEQRAKASAAFCRAFAQALALGCEGCWVASPPVKKAAVVAKDSGVKEAAGTVAGAEPEQMIAAAVADALSARHPLTAGGEHDASHAAFVAGAKALVHAMRFNPELRAQLLAAVLSAGELVELSPEELAPEELAQKRSALRADLMQDAIKKRESSMAVVMCPRCRKEQKAWYVFVAKSQVMSGFKAADRFEMTCQVCEFNWNRDALW